MEPDADELRAFVASMVAGSATEHVTSVPGELHYLAPESTVPRRFTAPGASV